MINNYFNGDFRQLLQKQVETIGLKGKDAIAIIATTSQTVKEILGAELRSGNYDEVLTFLKTNSIKIGKDVILDKIIQRVVGRLILRFGLPGSLALTLATLLVPFLVKRLGNKALKNGKIKNLFAVLGINDKMEKWNILKSQVKEKFSFKPAA